MEEVVTFQVHYVSWTMITLLIPYSLSFHDSSSVILITNLITTILISLNSVVFVDMKKMLH